MVGGPARASVLAAIARSIEEMRGRGTPVEETTALADVGIDSLDLVELGMMMESEWSVELRAEDHDAVRTVGDLVELVLRRAR